MPYSALLVLLAGAAADHPPDATKLFVTKVQPVLLNACATCHSGGKAGPFDLSRVTTSGGWQRNAAVAARYVNPAAPPKSPLLVQAVTAHGGARAPALRNDQAPAFKHLEAWVKLMTEAGATTPAAEPAGRPSAPGPRDEFDPEIFNRRARGGRSSVSK